MMIVLAIVFNVFFFLIVVNSKKRFALILPVYVVLSDALSILLPLGTKGVHNVLTILVVALFFLKSVIHKKSILTFNPWLLLLTLYYIILLPFSSNLFGSAIDMGIILLGFYMLPLGFYLIRSERDLMRLNMSLIYACYIFIINFILSITLHFGDNLYGLGIYGGALTREHSFFVVIIIVLAPLCILFRPNIKKHKLMIINVISFFILIFLFRRTTIISVIVSYMIFYIIFNLYRHQPILKNLLFIISSLLIVSLFIGDIKNIVDEKRGYDSNKSISEQVRSESRSLEIQYTYNYMMSFSNSIDSLFGREIFNQPAQRGLYGAGIIGEDRPLHTTIAILFHATGLCGTGLFIAVLLDMVIKFKNLTTYSIPSSIPITTIRTLLIVLFFNIIVNFYTRGLFTLSFGSILFLYIGSLMRQLYNHNLLSSRLMKKSYSN